MSMITDIENGVRTDVPEDIVEVLRKFKKGDAELLDYMIGNKQVRDAIGDRVDVLSRMREVARRINKESEVTLNDLLSRLSQVDLNTWNDIYHAGFNECNWPDEMIEDIIKKKIKENKWLSGKFNENGIINMYFIRNTNLSENITGHGSSMTVAILDAYTKAASKWMNK